MWLEYKYKPLVWIVLCCCQGRTDFCRMVCVIIDYCYSVHASFVLETTIGSAKRVKPLYDRIGVKSHCDSERDCSERVTCIMTARNGEFDFCELFTVMHCVKLRTRFLIIGQIFRIKVEGWVKSVCNDLLRKSVGKFLIIVNLSVNNGCTIGKCVACKLTEGVADVIEIFEEIEVFRFYI